MEKRLDDMQNALDNTKHQLENAKIEADKPFVKEAELSEKLERLAELNALLNMDEKDNDAIMIGGDEEDSEISAEEERVEIVKENGIVQDSKKPTARPSLKEKLEQMKGKAAELSTERKEPKQHMEKGEIISSLQ